jgi:hypothetical protein
MTEPHWATFHRVRFAEPVAATDHAFPRPEGLDLWRFCPAQTIGADGLPGFASDIWGGFALHDGRAGAEAMVDDPAARMPFLSGAVEHWHALARPFLHRGTVRWRDGDETDTAIRVCGAPGDGVLAVVTSAGFASRDAAQAPRIRRFLRGIEAVMEGYAGQPGNLRRATFNGGFDGRDGFTLSLWADGQAMGAAAYRAGAHRAQMDAHVAEAMFDRSSFSRFALLASRGSWDGDPLARSA